MGNHWLPSSVALLVWLVSGAAHGDGVVISELMASNRSTLPDADGDFVDWVELYNTGDLAADLAGWSLTDDPLEPAKWVFPAVQIAARGFIVVFASGKDERDPAAELHTNFNLLSEGEYLGLHDSSGQAASVYAPVFPEQLPDASYGASMVTQAFVVLDGTQSLTYFVPADDALGTDWTAPGFDDAAWRPGVGALGFDTKDTPDFADLVGTDVGADMQGVNSSIYLRVPFSLQAEDALRSFRLQLRYADGFIVYLNGTEIVRRNTRDADFPVPGASARALARRTPEDVRTAEEVRLPAAASLLKEGDNILAVHALSSRASDTEFLIDARLEAVQVNSTDGAAPGYFEVPSPGWPNPEALGGVAPDPVFAIDGGTFREAVTVELSVPDPQAEIRVTRDSSIPVSTSELYTGPIVVEGFELLHARAFQPGRLPSRTAAESYVVVGPEFVDFSSDLPIVMIHAKGLIALSGFTPGHIRIFDVNGGGRSALMGAVHMASHAAFKQRGSSTAGQPKVSMNVELRDERGDDQDAEFLGFPRESDFVLYAAYDIDRTMLRNAFAYELSNQAGRYASRTRFCEVFLNRGGGPLAERDYMGVYSFMEKLKRGKDRIDVEALSLRDNEEPDVEGGYILKRDRLDPGDLGLEAGGERLGLVYPKEEIITGAQAAWISGYFDRFAAALASDQWTDPEVGYRRYMDPAAWIDHHLFVVFTRNNDGLGLSTFFQKSRDGLLEMGPIWDYDRSMSSSVVVQDPIGFSGSKFTFSWWGRLFEDPWFWEQYKLRWKELRNGPLSTENLHALIDSMSAEIAEAQVRNFDRWGLVGGEVTWESLVAAMREWITIRVAWMDEEFIGAPQLSVEAGMVLAGQALELAVPRGAIYFTVDGSDPRGVGGEPAATSMRYEDAWALTTTVTVRARTRIETAGELDEGLWSGLVEATYEVEGATGGFQLPGDISQDGKINLLDAIGTLRYLVGQEASPCSGDGTGALLDWTGDGGIDLTDVLQGLNYLFQNGAPHEGGIECVPTPECPEVCGG